MAVSVEVAMRSRRVAGTNEHPAWRYALCLSVPFFSDASCAKTVPFDLPCTLPNGLTGLISGLFGCTVAGVYTYTLALR